LIPFRILATAAACTIAYSIAAAPRAFADEKPLIDFGAAGVESRIAPNSKDGSAFKIVDGPTGKALEVTLSPAAHGSPGVVLKSDGTPWDLTKYGEIDAVVTNTSTEPLSLFIRIDNPGDWHGSPWNMDRLGIPPGKTGTIKVVFGYSWGNVGYALDPSKVVQMLLFSNKPKADLTFRIDKVFATGTPGEKPAGHIEKLRPLPGTIIDFTTPFPAARVDSPLATTNVTPIGATVTFAAPTPGKNAGVSFKAPEASLWDLSMGNQAEFTVTNPGTQPVHAFCRVDNAYASNTKNSVVGDVTVAPGATKVVVIPFDTGTVWNPDDKAALPTFACDRVTGFTVVSDATGVGQTITLRKVVLSVSPAPPVPAWLGQRPPVTGSWTKTFEDNFDGATLNPKLWVVPEKPGASIWDSGSVNVAANAYVENGMMKIKVEKPAVPPKYDDPKLNERKYVSSVVTTFDKFAQRYGYFEARMKLPTAMGMWPAFWLMPDRGKAAGEWWKRQDTKNGGMEYDIMEYLTRFGPYHYNIAMHWDGYAKLHKATGTEHIWFQPDKDGFITSGLLWEPGKVTYYVNGRLAGTWKNDRVGVTPEYIMFTMPIGGWGTNGYVEDAKLPDTFQIDYVRVWQRDDLQNLPAYDPAAPVPVPTPTPAPAAPAPPK
jgi:beta-glucanase (GH16 family)